MVSKGTDKLGYHLVLDESGRPQMRLGFGSGSYVATALDALNDDEWHHLVAEYDREKEAVNIFVDGKASSIEKAGTLQNTVSLTNQEDFTVGRHSTEAKGFFRGSMDFVRLSQGSFADSETTIEELYEWQFNGPFLKDFFGSDPKGARRDVGAIEGE